ncbi:MAG: Wadjet anti-phage system protein JetD domain-containing protein [Bacteroidota bacterium]
MIPVEEIDAVRAVLITLQKQGPRRYWTTVVDELRKKLGVSETVAVEYLDAMIDKGVEMAPGAKKVTLNFDLPADYKAATAERWAGLVERLPDHIRPWVASAPRAAQELPEADAEALLTCLSRVSPGAFPGEDRFVLSANSVMGSSKALDSFPGLLGSVDEDDDCRHRPLFLVTAGPADPSAVLFVENPSAFGSLLHTEFVHRYLAICAFGYGLTIENLPQRLRSRSIIPCTAAGDQITDLAAIIASTPCYHWGDLDWEGLRIFENMQAAIPTICLPIIYLAMAERLGDPLRSHPYLELFGKQKQRAPKANDPLVAMLAKACAERAVDQEAMCPIEDVTSLVTPISAPTTRFASLKPQESGKSTSAGSAGAGRCAIAP